MVICYSFYFVKVKVSSVCSKLKCSKFALLSMVAANVPLVGVGSHFYHKYSYEAHTSNIAKKFFYEALHPPLR